MLDLLLCCWLKKRRKKKRGFCLVLAVATGDGVQCYAAADWRKERC